MKQEKSRESSPVVVGCLILDDKIEDSKCSQCYEKFEKFFNTETEDWMYKDAIRVNNIVVHQSCL